MHDEFHLHVRKVSMRVERTTTKILDTGVTRKLSSQKIETIYFV